VQNTKRRLNIREIGPRDELETDAQSRLFGQFAEFAKKVERIRSVSPSRCR
jgi:hypothetical protein